jgi:hypothetical protein
MPVLWRIPVHAVSPGIDLLADIPDILADIPDIDLLEDATLAVSEAVRNEGLILGRRKTPGYQLGNIGRARTPRQKCVRGAAS